VEGCSPRTQVRPAMLLRGQLSHHFSLPHTWHFQVTHPCSTWHQKCEARTSSPLALAWGEPAPKRFSRLCHANYERIATPDCGSAAIGAREAPCTEIDEERAHPCNRSASNRKQSTIIQSDATGRLDRCDVIVNIFRPRVWCGPGTRCVAH
jgi:hypothetical protein